MTSTSQAIADAVSLVWPGQAEFLLSDEKIIYDHSKMDYLCRNGTEF